MEKGAREVWVCAVEFLSVEESNRIVGGSMARRLVVKNREGDHRAGSSMAAAIWAGKSWFPKKSPG